MQKTIEGYFQDGCMRCPFGGTTACKAHQWQTELKMLREIILTTNLNEEIKWGAPCYTLNRANVLMLSALKDACTISFFKGALLKDETGLLEKPGPNSQAVRYLKLKHKTEINKQRNNILNYIYGAIEIEKSGLKVSFNNTINELPRELIDKFEADPAFKSAFGALTPGRQRGYIIHFSAPKQSKTRIGRIEKWTSSILQGEGMHDAYRKKNKKQ